MTNKRVIKAWYQRTDGNKNETKRTEITELFYDTPRVISEELTVTISTASKNKGSVIAILLTSIKTEGNSH